MDLIVIADDFDVKAEQKRVDATELLLRGKRRKATA
jgi:hypothetical protein